MTVNEENFESLIKGELPVMVDFGAEWCGPCKALAPVVEEIAGEYEGKAAVGTADIEECPNIAAQYRIRNVPTILFFKGGELVDKAVGGVAKKTLTDKLDALV